MIPLVYHASYSQLALPKQHRFPQTKYQNLQQYLLSQGIAQPYQFLTPKALDLQVLSQHHAPDYVEQVLTLQLANSLAKRIGFPQTKAIVDRSCYSVAGTILATQQALQHGIAIQLSGGYHHAHYDFGSGYCIFNDLIVAAKEINQQYDYKVLIFDCDVHQGDGTAAMAQDNEQIITCSVHCQSNFPARKQVSDHDIGLEDGLGDDPYVQTIDAVFRYLVQLHRPDMVIYDAGVDIHQQDDLGRLSVSTAGILARDLAVLNIAKKQQIPIACVIGGGYSKDPLELSVRHSQLFIAANQIWLQTES
ncbi:histone deacetylase [Shewanella sp. Scap07]|uniref:histone deacetylase family protein n=1 Tax=Shewanella sp. Scap07 TaxID=2589987 RepID=UPI0015BCED91|nr:histone deacetylase [Shewanella sp. Scap07]QLE84997.1 histone deacetylase [Shewanella sp. Scap07]